METNKPLILVDENERLALKVGESTLFYRRLSLAALAAIERSQTVMLPGRGQDPPKAVIPASALEAAICGRVLVGWEKVRCPRTGDQVEFTAGAASRLPAGIRRQLVRRAHGLQAPPKSAATTKDIKEKS